MSDDYNECERCGRSAQPIDMQNVHLFTEYELCVGCVEDLVRDVEDYDWRERYTEEHHERAVSLLSEQPEIECVIESYEDGQIVLHTPYVSSDLVTDFCEHFGFSVAAFGPRWETDGTWPCVDIHGSLFEIVLEYDHYSPPPVPPSVVFTKNRIEHLDGNDKQF